MTHKHSIFSAEARVNDGALAHIRTDIDNSCHLTIICEHADPTRYRVSSLIARRTAARTTPSDSGSSLDARQSREVAPFQIDCFVGHGMKVKRKSIVLAGGNIHYICIFMVIYIDYMSVSTEIASCQVCERIQIQIQASASHKYLHSHKLKRLLTIRCANQHGGKTLQLIFIERQLIFMPCVLVIHSNECPP